MNTCKTYQSIIESYIEGNLTEANKALLEKHTQTCPDCRSEYQQAQTLALVLDESFCPGHSAEQAAEAVLASLPEIPAASHKPLRWLTFGKIAAGLLIIIGLTLSFYAGRTSNHWKTDNLIQAPYTISELQGTVLIKHADSEIWQPLAADSTIYIDDQFLSSPDSRVTFVVDGKSHIELKENSMLVLDITPDKTDLHLVHGTLDADLASPHGPFFVTTPHGRAEALGTEFTVKVD